MKSFNQLRESKNALEDMEILDYILSEMSIDDLEELSEGPFSRVGKFMMKRKLEKQVKKLTADVAKHTDAQDQAKKAASAKLGPKKFGETPNGANNHLMWARQDAVDDAHHKHQPNIDKAKKMASRASKALNRLKGK